MTMLTSLKALLFATSASSGVKTDAIPTEGGGDFAQMLNSVGVASTATARPTIAPFIVADAVATSKKMLEYQDHDGKGWHPVVADATPPLISVAPEPQTANLHLPVQLAVSFQKPEEARPLAGAALVPASLAEVDASIALIPAQVDTMADTPMPGTDAPTPEQAAEPISPAAASSATPATPPVEPAAPAPASLKAHPAAPRHPAPPIDMADTPEAEELPSDEANAVAQDDGQSSSPPIVMVMAPPALVLPLFVAPVEQTPTEQVKPAPRRAPSIGAPARMAQPAPVAPLDSASIPGPAVAATPAVQMVASPAPIAALHDSAPPLTAEARMPAADQSAAASNAARPTSPLTSANPISTARSTSAAPLVPQVATPPVAAVAVPAAAASPVPTIVPQGEAPRLPDDARARTIDDPAAARTTSKPIAASASAAPLVPQVATPPVAAMAAPLTVASPVPTIAPQGEAPGLPDDARTRGTDHPATAPAPAPATPMPIAASASAAPLVPQIATPPVAALAVPAVAASPAPTIVPPGVAPTLPDEAPMMAADHPAAAPAPDALRPTGQPASAASMPTAGSVSAAPPVAVLVAPTPEILPASLVAPATPATAEALDLPADVAQAPIPTAPVKPRAEAVSLLQLVRDHMSLRVSRRPETAAPARDMAPDVGSAILPTTISDDSPSLAPLVQPTVQPLAPPAPTAPTAPVIPTIDLSASLGAQIVDMGVSGQWIDGLARDVAGLSANGAQGRFQINADQLGPIQVDIRQGADGAAISLTVATEAAEQALRQESDRLRLDAGLSAMRISEVKIERAPHVAETARADSSGNQNSSQQQSGGQGQNPSQSMGQGAGQGMGQNPGQSSAQSHMQGHGQQRENIALGHKAGSDAAVLNHTDVGESAGGAVRARYA
ncbi:hypothetical protein sphantq_02555 [Sphingobium sp. AntQ-1]|uniref:flagellar hook-length control protein FliK n=1 Tax=Sphingobium sp. AntQ-1 TaxID=2930091 RepID=UPI00234EC88B|nr:flagellar hook-length control protein FliK [Sphingobium sp. AntQ-1]WCP14112.1 hypothetical protein sphantq_02555 [Sphingobium sp. AntQ-1]